jgi:hypothetical protein
MVGGLIRSIPNLFDVLAVAGCALEDSSANHGYQERKEVMPSTLSQDFIKMGSSFVRKYDDENPVGLLAGHV